jgi:hypothetical protein
MKKDYDKRIFHNFKTYNTDEVEEYLNQMAEKGYYLLEMTEYQMFFKKDKSRKVRYSIVFVPNNEDQKSYRDYCTKAGWIFVYSKNNMQIYMTEDNELACIDSDETKFEVLKKIRNKILMFHTLKLCALLAAAILVSDYMGLAIISLSVAGFCLTLMGGLYSFFLISEVIDTLFWIKQSKNKLARNEKLDFQFYTITRCIDKAVYFLIYLCVSIMVLESFYRFAFGWKVYNPSRIKLMIVTFSFYFVFTIIFRKIDGTFSKRGAFIRVLAQMFAFFASYIVAMVGIDGVGSEAVTFFPEKFQLVYVEENTSKMLKRNQSILGSREYYYFLGADKEWNSVDYEYYLYQSKFPFILQQVKNESFRTENISEYLKIYKQTNQYTVYIGSNRKFYPAYSTYEIYDTNIEAYDGCIVIEEKSQLLIFYYKDFKNMNVDQIIAILDDN